MVTVRGIFSFYNPTVSTRRARPMDCAKLQFQEWGYPGEAECVAAAGKPPLPPATP